MVWRAARRAPAWICEAWPETMWEKAARASAEVRWCPLTALVRRGTRVGVESVKGGWGGGVMVLPYAAGFER